MMYVGLFLCFGGGYNNQNKPFIIVGRIINGLLLSEIGMELSDESSFKIL